MRGPWVNQSFEPVHQNDWIICNWTICALSFSIKTHFWMRLIVQIYDYMMPVSANSFNAPVTPTLTELRKQTWIKELMSRWYEHVWTEQSNEGSTLLFLCIQLDCVKKVSTQRLVYSLKIIWTFTFHIIIWCKKCGICYVIVWLCKQTWCAIDVCTVSIINCIITTQSFHRCKWNVCVHDSFCLLYYSRLQNKVINWDSFVTWELNKYNFHWCMLFYDWIVFDCILLV